MTCGTDDRAEAAELPSLAASRSARDYRHNLHGKYDNPKSFHAVFAAVSDAMNHIPRSSSLVENLNSRLRNYFTLRRHLGASYLGLLRFFLNHRRFVRSRRAERQGRSPRELMTGQPHPHWLTLLGFGELQPRQG